MKNMRLVFAVSNDIFTDQRMIKVGNSLAKAGHEVHIVGRDLKRTYNSDKQQFKSHRLKCFFNSGKLFYLELNLRLWLFIRKTKWDIVTAVDMDTIIGCSWGKKKAKLYLDAHELFSEVPELDNRLMSKRVWRWVENRFISKCDKRISVSQGVADCYANRHSSSFEVIMNAPKTVEIQPIEKEYDFIYQGALNEGRGLEIAIKAAHSGGHKLLIVGSGDLEEELLELHRSLGSPDNIVFAGVMPPDQLPNETVKARVGLNLLEDRSLSYYHSLANKFFDYAHAGLISINMNFPEYARIMETCPVGILIDKLEVTSLQLAMEQALTTEVNAPLFANISKFRKLYSWENEEERLLKLYQS